MFLSVIFCIFVATSSFAPGYAAVAVAMGLKAVNTIINDAKKIGVGLYVKKGNYEQALQQFHKLNPQAVQIIGKNGVRGIVGDRRIRVLKPEKNKDARMDIKQFNSRRRYRIYYKPDI